MLNKDYLSIYLPGLLDVLRLFGVPLLLAFLGLLEFPGLLEVKST